MNFWNIVKTVGTNIVEDVVPGGKSIVKIVNEILPGDEQLPSNATGDQVQSAVMKLPPTEQAKILSKKFDVKIENIKQSNETLRFMLEHDAKNPQSTRPTIALGSFRVIAFCIIAVVSTWSFAVLTNKQDMVKLVMEGWPFILAVLAPLVALLRAYFGLLNQEKKAVLDASNNRPATTGLISSIARLFKK